MQPLVHVAIAIADASYPSRPSEELTVLVLTEYGLDADEATIADAMREAREFVQEWLAEG